MSQEVPNTPSGKRSFASLLLQAAIVFITSIVAHAWTVPAALLVYVVIVGLLILGCAANGSFD